MLSTILGSFIGSFLGIGAILGVCVVFALRANKKRSREIENLVFGKGER